MVALAPVQESLLPWLVGTELKDCKKILGLGLGLTVARMMHCTPEECNDGSDCEAVVVP